MVVVDARKFIKATWKMPTFFFGLASSLTSATSTILNNVEYIHNGFERSPELLAELEDSSDFYFKFQRPFNSMQYP
jgi:hypothetical protein